MIAKLNSIETEKVWQYARLIDGKEMRPTIRQDILGAEIHKNDYNNMKSFYGWVVEYVISPEELRMMGIDDSNVLCEANIRILQIDNYHRNIGHKRGHYAAHPYDECIKHLHIATLKSNITEEGILELQRAFGLSNEQIEKIFM